LGNWRIKLTYGFDDEEVTNRGDGETPTVAESRALLNAKRAALERAGTYVESYTKVRNFQLTQDQIQVT
jgi:hypothetical protein